MSASSAHSPCEDDGDEGARGCASSSVSGECTGALVAGSASSMGAAEATGTAASPRPGQASDSTRDTIGEAPVVPTSPTVPDASVDTGRTALSACHGVSSGPRSSTGVAIRHPECVRKRYSDHVMTLPPATDVGPSGPSTTTSNAPRTAMCAPPASSMIATKLGSDARLAANADVSSCNKTGRSAPSTMSSQNRWASAS